MSFKYTMRSTLFLLLAPTFWGINFHLVQIALKEAHFIEGGFWRYVFGCVALLLVTLWNKRPSLTPLRTHAVGFALVGFIGLCAFNLLFFFGLKYTQAVNGSLIISLNPVMTSVLAFFVFGSAIKRREVIGLFVALVGVIYLLTQGDFDKLASLSFNIGDLIIFAANVVFALNHIWVKKYAVNISNRDFTLYTNLVCFLGFVIAAPFVPFSRITGYSNSFWLAAAGMGVLGTALAYLLWNEGVKKVGPSRAGIFMNMVPLSTAVTSVFFGQQLYSYHYISGVIIIVGVLYVQGVFRFSEKRN